MANAALSELSVTEFVALARLGFFPRGLVVGSCVYSAGIQYDWPVATQEVPLLSEGLRVVRKQAVERMRAQARALGADGVVEVRLEVEHQVWRNTRQVARCVAIGTAIAFDPARAPTSLRAAPRLQLSDGAPFDSDLSGADFVRLLGAGYRPVTVAMGSCVYGLDPRDLRNYHGQDAEISGYTQAFFDARETAMDQLQRDLFEQWPRGGPDTPVGIVGMTVAERTVGGAGGSGLPVVEFTAVGTAVADLAPDDPRRGAGLPRPRVVVPLDR